MTINNNIYAQAHENRIQFHKDLVFFPDAREKASCFVDGNSVLRNTAAAIPLVVEIPAAAAFVNGSAVIGGMLGVPLGLSIVRESYKRWRSALRLGDAEGVCHYTLLGAAGLSFSGISGLLTADGIMGSQGIAVPAAMSTAFCGCGFGMYGALAGHSGHGLVQARLFGNELKSKSQSQALEWLHRQIRLEPGEGEEHLQKKWSAFELRVGVDCAKMVREKLPEVMKNPLSPQAGALIQEVEKANLKQQIKYALLLFIALLGIATVFAMLFTTGPIAPALFAIGAMLWFTVDSSRLHNYIGEKYWTWHTEKKQQANLEVHWKSPLIA